MACIDEALSLRNAGIALPILIMGYTPPQCTGALIENDLTQTIYSLDMAEAFSGEASAFGKVLKIHVKADSGMGRLGFTSHDGRDPLEEIVRVLELPGLYPEGIFSHFAVADVYGDEFLHQYMRIYRGQVFPDEVFHEYDVRRVLIEPDSALTTLLEQSPEWSEVYRDEMAVLFTRAGPQ